MASPSRLTATAMCTPAYLYGARANSTQPPGRTGFIQATCHHNLLEPESQTSANCGLERPRGAVSCALVGNGVRGGGRMSSCGRGPGLRALDFPRAALPWTSAAHLPPSRQRQSSCGQQPWPSLLHPPRNRRGQANGLPLPQAVPGQAWVSPGSGSNTFGAEIKRQERGLCVVRRVTFSYSILLSFFSKELSPEIGRTET